MESGSVLDGLDVDSPITANQDKGLGSNRTLTQGYSVESIRLNYNWRPQRQIMKRNRQKIQWK